MPIKLILLFLFLFPSLSFADITTGLVDEWAFDEGTGTSTTADSGSNNYTGNLQGSPSWIAGKIGPYALAFNGSSQYVYTSSVTPAGSAMTISYWMNGATLVSTFSIAVCQWNETGNLRSWSIGQLANAGKIALYTSVDGSASGDFLSGTQVANGAWHMITGVINGASSAIYIDGVSSNTGTESTPYSTSQPIRIGYSPRFGGTNNQYFAGDLDDVRIYNRALTGTDIAQLYAYTGSSHLNLINGVSKISGVSSIQ